MKIIKEKIYDEKKKIKKVNVKEKEIEIIEIVIIFSNIREV